MHLSMRDSKKIGGMGKQIIHSLVERDSEVGSHHIANISGKTLRPLIVINDLPDYPMALQRCEHLSHPSQPIPLASAAAPMVDVLMDGRALRLPERVPDAAASALPLSSGECARLLDYADSVGP
jgi:hypothetical protein